MVLSILQPQIYSIILMEYLCIKFLKMVKLYKSLKTY